MTLYTLAAYAICALSTFCYLKDDGFLYPDNGSKFDAVVDGAVMVAFWPCTIAAALYVKISDRFFPNKEMY